MTSVQAWTSAVQLHKLSDRERQHGLEQASVAQTSLRKRMRDLWDQNHSIVASLYNLSSSDAECTEIVLKLKVGSL